MLMSSSLNYAMARQAREIEPSSARHDLIVCIMCGITNEMVAHNPVTIKLVSSEQQMMTSKSGDLCDICRGPVRAPLGEHASRTTCNYQCHECKKVFARAGGVHWIQIMLCY